MASNEPDSEAIQTNDNYEMQNMSGGDSGYKEPLSTIQTASPAASSPVAPTSGVYKEPKGCCKGLHDYWVNEGVKVIFVSIYVVVNIVLIVERYHFYWFRQTADDLPGNSTLTPFDVLGHGLCVARGTAAAIKFNCAFLLVCVLRNFLSFLRGSFVGTYLPIDKNIVLHKYVAWFVLVLVTLHSGAHFINFFRVTDGRATADELRALNLGTTPVSYWIVVGTRLPGITGVITSIVMILMYTSAVEYVRSNMFEAFWYTHHLFIVFYGLIAAHGQLELLERSSFWLWVLGPFIFYALERLVRLIRGSQKTIILKAIQHPSKVIELQMRKVSFKYQPGQYVFLQCPYIAQYEWHPFTISSSPDEDFLSVHIRVAGDWTGELVRMLNPNGDMGVVQENMLSAPNGTPIMLIDGPYGAASEDFYKFKNLMLFSAGIGVTPMASILKDISYQIDQGNLQINKVHFYWTNRDRHAFEWFIKLLSNMEKKSSLDFLEINIYLTSKLSPDQIKAVMVAGDDAPDQVTGLEARTQYHRPKIDQIFRQQEQLYKGQKVGVFFCGPPVFSKKLNAAAKKYTRRGTKFVYHKENF